MKLVIIEPLGCENQVYSGRNIGSLHLLMLHDGVSGTIFLQEVIKGEVASTEVHGRCYAELEASVETEFS